MESVFTIGHSTQPSVDFIAKLKRHDVTDVFDVRSVPYSQFNPQFDREKLKSKLNAAGIRYLHMGKTLGARSDDPSCYENGRVKYDRLAQKPEFRSAIDRIIRGAKGGYRIALMCAEKEPLDCHRSILVSRAIDAQHVQVMHILGDGTLESHEDTLRRLIAILGKTGQGDLFLSDREQVEHAYRVREKDIAYAEEQEPAVVIGL